jgi:hypothetical protein
VPLLRDLAGNAEQRAVFDFISKAVVVARPIATNAEVPRERVNALRRAFEAAMADPQFLDEAQRQNLDVAATSGEEMQGLVGEMLATSPQILAQVAQAIQIKSAQPAKGAKPSAPE